MYVWLSTEGLQNRDMHKNLFLIANSREKICTAFGVSSSWMNNLNQC